MKRFKNRDMNIGVAFLFIVFMLLFLLFIYRFFHIQATGKVVGVDVEEMTKELQQDDKVIPTSRGTIFDSNGIVLAEDASGYQLAAKIKGESNPPSKRDYILEDEKPKVAAALADILDADENYILKQLNSDKIQVEFGYFGRNLTYAQKVEIEKLKTPGLLIFTSDKRYYPNGTFASHILGFVDNEEKGAMGIEKKYNDLLKNKDGKIEFTKDRKGVILPRIDEKEIEEPINGDDIYLTIDHKIQSFLEDALSQADEKYKPERMVAIVSNPKTGEILAMSSRPSFDPNTKEIKDYSNHAISNAFEPGSTMKVFTLAAAINEGKYNGSDYFQSGSYKSVTTSKGPTIRDHNKVGWGSITFDEGVQRSSNVGFAILAEQKLGFDKLYEYLHAFNFHKTTGIDLPGESVGTILYNYPIEKITTAFGQGTSITPIQQIQAMSAIATDGTMKKPYVIDRIVDSDTGETIEETKSEVVGSPISSDTAKKVRDILETVVTSENGTGTAFALEDYSVAGKTGTAQIPNPSGKGYLSGYGKNIFSFLGMAPKEDPELIMYVAVDRPNLDGVSSGGKVVADIFTSVMQNSLQYLKVKPTKKADKQDKEDTEGVVVDSVEGLSMTEGKKKIEKQGFTFVSIGDGEIISQYPEAGDRLLNHSKVFAVSTSGQKMPDITNWTRQEISVLGRLLGVEIHFIGNGYAYNQSIKEGTPIKQNDKLIVKLKLPNEEGEAEPEGKPDEDEPLD